MKHLYFIKKKEDEHIFDAVSSIRDMVLSKEYAEGTKDIIGYYCSRDSQFFIKNICLVGLYTYFTKTKIQLAYRTYVKNK